jgi:hypothetical protein
MLASPKSVDPSQIRFSFHLEPQVEQDLEFAIFCELNGSHLIAPGFQAALISATAQMRHSEQDEVEICTSNAQFNEWLNRSRADLRMMIASTPLCRFDRNPAR